MRKLIGIIIAFAFALPAFAQRGDSDIQTLFGDEELRSGGYGGIELRATNANEEIGVLVGGRGGWIINSMFSIGGGGYGLVSNHAIDNYFSKDDPNYGKSVYFRAGYGGVFLEYINSSNDLIHFTVNALIGGGGASYTTSVSEMIHNDEARSHNTFENSSFFVFEPGVTADINVTRFMRIGLGVNYRIVSGLELSHSGDGDFTGLSGNIIFKFGKF
jgi:hypothetical protein